MKYNPSIPHQIVLYIKVDNMVDAVSKYMTLQTYHSGFFFERAETSQTFFRDAQFLPE
jgi:hypothetical protein